MTTYVQSIEKLLEEDGNLQRWKGYFEVELQLTENHLEKVKVWIKSRELFFKYMKVSALSTTYNKILREHLHIARKEKKILEKKISSIQKYSILINNRLLKEQFNEAILEVRDVNDARERGELE